MTPHHREARLRPEFAELYPPLDPDRWMPAAVASARMLLWQTRQPSAAKLGQRTLDSRHFEFRGGVADPDRQQRTRFDDHGTTGWPLRRQARLRDTCAELYPALQAGVWIEAAELGATLLRWITGQETGFSLGSRLLPEEHFEFRGGELPRGSIKSPRTRREDPAEGRGLAAG